MIQKIIKKITFFDVLIYGTCFVVILFIAYYFLRKTEWKEVAIKVTQPNMYWGGRPTSWLADNLRTGLEERDGIGRTIAKIVDIQIFEREADKKDLYLKVDLKSYFDGKKKQYYFQNQNILIGNPIKLEFSGISIQGLITDIAGYSEEKIYKEKIVESRLLSDNVIYPETEGVQPWVADAIKIGDEVKGSDGKAIAKILDKKVLPAQKIVTTSQGSVFITDDPIKKDVYLKLWLLAWERKGVLYFFDDVKVKIDQDIPLYFKNIVVYPVITKIIE